MVTSAHGTFVYRMFKDEPGVIHSIDIETAKRKLANFYNENSIDEMLDSGEIIETAFAFYCGELETMEKAFAEQIAKAN